MARNYKDFERKEVTLFWKDGSEERTFIERVNGPCVFAKIKDNDMPIWISTHLIDDMELCFGDVKNPEVEVDKLSHAIESMIADKPRQKSKRVTQKKKPRASFKEGMWHCHFGNGKGIFVRGTGTTVKDAYIDWLIKHTHIQSKSRNGKNQ